MEIRKYFIKNIYMDRFYMKYLRPFMYYITIYPYELLNILLIKIGFDCRYENLKKYKNIYRGKRCFIIGTGPSLTKEIYKMLRGEITLGVNGLCLWFEEFYPTTHFFISDKYAYERLRDSLPSNTFVTSYIVKNVNIDTMVQPVNVSRYNYFCDIRPKISDDLSVVTYDFNSVIFFAIQFAIYSGIKNIYLLGVDCNYNSKKLYSVDHGIRHKTEYMNDVGLKMIENFKKIKKYCDNNGIKIYNATDGGMLEVFPRVDIDEVLKGRVNEKGTIRND